MNFGGIRVTGKIIDGKAIGKEIREEIKERVDALKGKGLQPGLRLFL